MRLIPSNPERGRRLLLSGVVVAGVGAVAYTDWAVQSHISLGYLYLLPLALSGLVHRLRTSLALAVACVTLLDWFGPFEHATWQHTVRILLTLLGYCAVVIVVNRLGRQRQEYFRVVKQQRDALARELKMAADVQRHMLPREGPRRPGVDIAGRMVPVSLVGGDYYDYLELPDGALGLVIGDVSGKGAPAALLMPTVKTGLRLVVPESHGTDTALSELNKIIYEVTDQSRYVSLFYGRLDVGSRRLEYTNAGHVPPLLYRTAGDEAIWLDTGGPVAGLLEDARYEVGTVELQPGDILVLYTDGITEAWSEHDDRQARQHLLRLVSAHADDTAASLVNAINRSAQELGEAGTTRDDATVIVVRVLEA